MELCDRCGGEPENVDGIPLVPLVRSNGRKLCPECLDVTSDGSTLVGSARIPIF